jgi:hypothetical protein
VSSIESNTKNCEPFSCPSRSSEIRMKKFPDQPSASSRRQRSRRYS